MRRKIVVGLTADLATVVTIPEWIGLALARYPADLIALDADITATMRILVPRVDANVGERLPPAIDPIVDNGHVPTTGHGNSVLTGINQNIVAGCLISTTVVAQHNAAAGRAWSAANNQIVFNQNWSLRRAARLIEANGVFG